MEVAAAVASSTRNRGRKREQAGRVATQEALAAGATAAEPAEAPGAALVAMAGGAADVAGREATGVMDLTATVAAILPRTAPQGA